jgi:hypothetical protein
MALSRPPLLTLLQEILGWTLDRTADLPRSQRFTFGQRLDGLTLESLLLAQRAAVTGDRPAKAKHLGELSVLLDQLRIHRCGGPCRSAGGPRPQHVGQAELRRFLGVGRPSHTLRPGTGRAPPAVPALASSKREWLGDGLSGWID